MQTRNSILLMVVVSMLTACGGADEPSYRLKSTEIKDKTGTLQATATYTYNESGRIIKRESVSAVATARTFVFTYNYNAQGQLTEVLQSPFEGGTVDFRTTYEFNQAGQVVKTSSDYLADGSVEYIDSYEYNEKGQPIKRDSKDSKGSSRYYDLYYYDDNGYTNKTERVSNLNKVTNLYTNTMNELGQLVIQVTDNQADGITDFTKYYTYEQGPCVALEPNAFLHYCGR